MDSPTQNIPKNSNILLGFYHFPKTGATGHHFVIDPQKPDQHVRSSHKIIPIRCVLYGIFTGSSGSYLRFKSQNQTLDLFFPSFSSIRSLSNDQVSVNLFLLITIFQ